MFDIGFWELLIIAVVMLLVIGPERMPEMAKQLAFLIRKARQSMYRLRSEMKSELGDTPFSDMQKAREEINDLKNDIKQMGRDFIGSEADINQAVQDVPDSLVNELKNSQPMDSEVSKRKVSKRKVSKRKVSKRKTSKKKMTKKVITEKIIKQQAEQSSVKKDSKKAASKKKSKRKKVTKKNLNDNIQGSNG